jgi:VWFA-related protein
MHKLSRLSIAALLCLTSLVVVSAQKKPKPTPTPKPDETGDVVRISTELVQTDVMVFDKDGKFVNGLQPDQFELLIDGKPQPIEFFESVVAGARNERAALKAARDKKGKPVEEPAAQTSDEGRQILFFINDLHLDPGSLARTHKTVSYYIDHMVGPNDQVAITSASGQIGFLQQLTNNHAVLHAALNRLKMVAGTAPDTESPYISAYAAYLMVEQRDQQLHDYYVRQIMGAQNVDEGLAANILERRLPVILRQSDVTVRTALISLINLMDVTAKLPGRKLVFFISDGFLPNFTGSDFPAMMSRATRAANRSGTVIYSLDAHGLMVDSGLDASNGGGADPFGVLTSRMGAERNFTQEPLYALAADTGGRALLNSNDLTDGLARALDETSRYYLLAWKPGSDAERASNFSKIKVSVTGHPELKVQVRRGYLGSLGEQPKTAKAEATTVEIDKTDDLGVAESSNEEMRTAVALGYKQTGGENMQLTTTVQVNVQSPNDSSGSVEVNVLGAVFDSNGKAVGSFKRSLVAPRTPAHAVPTYATVNHQVDVPPGIYQVRVFAYERGTTKLSPAMEWIEVPKTKPGTFAISSLYVGEASQTSEGGQVSVNAHRRFARNSRMRFTTYIYNAAHSSSAPQLGVQIKILKGTQAVITPAEAKVSTDKVTNPANISYTGEFPLSSLAPGSYVLQVTVTDHTTNTSASQELRFTIY